MSFYWIALSLGIMGSLHCLGMCGPLALKFSGLHPNKSQLAQFLDSIYYHLGRSATYALLGIVFASIGSLVQLVHFQKILSIALGLFLIISFFFSINVEHAVNRMPLIDRYVKAVRRMMNIVYTNAQKYPTSVLGMINGLLPCGLVYLAIMGSLTATTLVEGGIFMFIFGLGTIPALIILTFGQQIINLKHRLLLNRALTFVSFFFGIFLIYRGFAVDLPEQWDFQIAIKNPIMCH